MLRIVRVCVCACLCAACCWCCVLCVLRVACAVCSVRAACAVCVCDSMPGLISCLVFCRAEGARIQDPSRDRRLGPAEPQRRHRSRRVPVPARPFLGGTGGPRGQEAEARVTPKIQISRRYHIPPKVNLLTTHVHWQSSEREAQAHIQRSRCCRPGGRRAHPGEYRKERRAFWCSKAVPLLAHQNLCHVLDEGGQVLYDFVGNKAKIQNDQNSFYCLQVCVAHLVLQRTRVRGKSSEKFSGEVQWRTAAV